MGRTAAKGVRAEVRAAIRSLILALLVPASLGQDLGSLLPAEGAMVPPAPFHRGGVDGAWPGFPEECALDLLRDGRVVGHAVVHRTPHGGLLHGVVRREHEPGPIRARVASRPGPPLVRGLGDAVEVGMRSCVVRLGPGPALLGPGFELRFGATCPTKWRIVHVCPVRVEVLGEGSAGGFPAAALHVLAVLTPELDRVDLHLHVQAPQSTVLREGLWLALQLLEAPRGPGETGEPAAPRRSFRREGAFWIDGEGRAVPGAEAALRPAERLLLRAPLGSGAGGLHLVRSLDPPLLHLALLREGTPLDRGEGRIFRAAFGLGLGDLPAPPVCLPKPPLEPGPPEQDPPWQVALASFLADESLGFARFGEEAGDWSFASGDAGNLEYDTILGLLAVGEAHGLGTALLAARTAADHALGIDRDAAGTGLFFPHGAGHRRAVVEAGHHWVHGLRALLRAEPDSLRESLLQEVLEAQARELAGLDPETAYPRSLAWGILALTANLEEGVAPREAARILRRFLEHLAAARTACGVLALVGRLHHEGTTPESVFVQGGILAPALAALGGQRGFGHARGLARGLAEAVWRSALQDPGSAAPALADKLHLDRRRGRVVAAAGRLRPAEQVLVLGGLRAASSELRKEPAWSRAWSAALASPAILSRRRPGHELSMLLRGLAWSDPRSGPAAPQKARVPWSVPSPSR